MTRRARWWAVLSGSVLVAILVLVFVGLQVVQSQWFGDYLTDKVVATVEDSTGGRAEVGSFHFDVWRLTVQMRDFTLHGTEGAGAAPLAHAALLELRLKLFAGFRKAIDLAYLGISQPRVNLIVNADGTTNVPAPKVKRAPSETSGLETVVDLAVGQFKIDDGLLLLSQRASQFSAKGNDLRVLLNFNSFNSSYEGRIQIDPLVLTDGAGSPLRVSVSLPLLLEKDALSVSGGRLSTDASQVLINAGLRNLNSPKITARVNAKVALRDVSDALNIPLDLKARDVPGNLTAELEAKYDQQTSAIQVMAAHTVLGRTSFEAAGTLRPGAGDALRFNGSLALDQLSRLANLGTRELAGSLQLHGHAGMDAHQNYAADGTVSSQGLGVRSGTQRIADIQVSSPFHADPYLISLDGLKVSALGGSVGAKVFIEKLERLSVEGHLSNFSIPVLAQAFSGQQLGYDGTVSGVISAKSNFHAKGTSGLIAETRLTIVPGTRGVALSGEVDGSFDGASGVIGLEKSHLALPNSRVDLSGNINNQLNLELVSRNLNDFLPAANFGSAKPQSSLPITLRGGAAHVNAQVRGDLSAPQISAHASIDHFAVRGSAIQHAAMDMQASPSNVTASNGVLTSEGLTSTFNGSLGLRRWRPMPRSPLIANVSVPNGQLADVLAIAGENDGAASGRVSAEVHVAGTYGDPLGNASVQVLNGEAYGQPFAKLQANVDLAHQLITLTNMELDAAGGQLSASATFRHPSESFQVGHTEFRIKTTSIQLANVVPLEQRSPGAAGVLNLTGDGAGDLALEGEFQLSRLNTDFSARGLKVNNQSAGDLFAQAHTSNGSVQYNIHSDFAGSSIRVDGVTSLAKGFSSKATAAINNLAIEKALALAGKGDVPAKGVLSANANVSGNLTNPEAVLDFTLAKAVIYTEPVNSFSTNLHYSNTEVDVSQLHLDVPAGVLNAYGKLNHPSGDFSTGQMQLHLDSSDMDLSKIRHLVDAEPGLGGGFRVVADLAGNLRQQAGKPALLLSLVNADLNAHSLQVNRRNLGELHATAKTERKVVNYSLESNLAQADLRASGHTELAGEYATKAKLAFGNVRYANVAPFIPSDSSVKPAFDALVDGEASIDGPILNADALAGRVQLNQLVVKTVSAGSATGAPGHRTVQLQNAGPVIMSLDHSLIKVEQFEIAGGEKTSLELGGEISLAGGNKALGLKVKGNADLGVLQDADRDFYSSGSVVVDATVHGSLMKPLVNGRVELQNANINYTDLPNGLSNGNGVIQLNGTTATIQNLSGESGGGKVAVTGFAGYTPAAGIFNLHAKASKVRTRYAGASVTSSVDITLAGSTKRSTLSGSVAVQRIAYSSSSDVGSILSGASVPPATSSAPSPLLSGMRVDLRIVTAPDLRVVTTYADKISLTSNLNVRGTAQDPGVVGRISITDGDLVFFGNTYKVNTGSINFYNPNQIQPILDFSLETVAQGVDVTLGVTGPVNDLKLSYRSDPALSFEQIVQLLATNTTPSDPTIAAHQPTPPQQSMSQMGESAVLGSAVANPLASRVQRVFGLTQFKIDPSLSGSNGQPSARVTLQQKIASNLTFTYITDVTQTNSEIVRVQLDVTPSVSAVALRDYNGNVSVELFYKFQRR